MDDLITMECKCCGARMNPEDERDGVIHCAYCGYFFTRPKKEVTPAVLSFLRAGEHDLDTGKFDDAYSAFVKAAGLDNTEPEAYWGMALAQFKIQYLKDHVTRRLQPICHEISERRFTDSKNFLSALRYATDEQRKQYESKGEEIDYIQSEFFKLQREGVHYDCFLCVKVTGENGEKTEDYKDADYIYTLLRDKGFSPFFSERNIRNKTGADYEAQILYALKTSETMLVICRNEDFLQTPWVKNEYARFLRLVHDEEKESDSITFVYYQKPIEKLPGKKGKIQGIDFSLREADCKIIDFVETHTPIARKRREEANLRKQKEDEERRSKQDEQARLIAEQQKAMEEMREQMRKLLQMQNTREEGEKETREEADRKAKTEAEQKAKEETEQKAKLAATVNAPAAFVSSDFVVKDGVLKQYKGNGGDVIIPDGVIEIGENAFFECSSLTSITIPNGVTTIGDEAFCRCTGLVNVTIPESVVLIGNDTFADCTSLKNINIPESVASIGGGAFAGCINLTNIIIPSGVTSLGEVVFAECESLTNIIIPNGVTLIDSEAFLGCINLTEIFIPSSVISIGEKVFEGCEKLTIYCEMTAESRGWNFQALFGNCKVVEGVKEIIKETVEQEKQKAEEEVTQKEKEETEHKVEIETERRTKQETEHKTKKEAERETQAEAEQKEKLELERKAKEEAEKKAREAAHDFQIENGVLIRYNGGGGDVIIPDGVIEIGENAFFYCRSFLRSITIPNSVITIREKAFLACTDLISVIIPNSVTTIGSQAFFNCANLTNIKMMGGVTTIGEHAFSECRRLKSITMSPSTTTIARGAFANCERLVNITIPNKVTAIGEEAFYNCVSLTNIAIPNNVTSIGEKAFVFCRKLTINCEAPSKPKGWDKNWDVIENKKLFPKRCRVIWRTK